MRTRQLYTYIDEQGIKRTNVVWFGASGRRLIGFGNFSWDNAKWDSDKGGNTIWANDKHDNFSTNQQSVADNLTQRLSIIKNELWYNISYGLPIFDKTRSKTAFDSFVLTVVNQHPDVNNIVSFKSEVINHKYSCYIEIMSIYGQVNIKL